MEIVDDFDYRPEYGWPADEAAYGRYADVKAAAWRGPDGPPRGPRNGQRYPSPASGPMPAYQPPNGGPVRGYPPSPGRRPAPPPYSPDPIRTYRPDLGDPMMAYQPRTSGPIPAYRPDMSGPMPAYRPDTSGPIPAYRPDTSGPMPAYRPETSGPMPAYRVPSGGPAGGRERTRTALLSGFPVSEPIRTYQPPADRPDAARRRPADGRQILSWLPFGSRLVLLPKDPRGDDEELRGHRDAGGGWLRPAVFGAMDGLVTNSSLIAGVGAGGAHGAIVLTGIAGLIAGAFSMATGEYISVSSQNELTQAEVELERKLHARDPAGKQRRLIDLFVEKGVSPNLAEAVVRQISADPERAVATHVREELGIDPDDLPSPRTAAAASLASFIVGALIPLFPFLVGYPVLGAALALSGVAAFAGGAAVAKLTGRSMLLGGLRQFTAAALATGAALLIGHAVGGHLS